MIKIETMNLKELRKFAAALAEKNEQLLLYNDRLCELNDILVDMHLSLIHI